MWGQKSDGSNLFLSTTKQVLECFSWQLNESLGKSSDRFFILIFSQNFFLTKKILIVSIWIDKTLLSVWNKIKVIHAPEISNWNSWILQYKFFTSFFVSNVFTISAAGFFRCHDCPYFKTRKTLKNFAFEAHLKKYCPDVSIFIKNEKIWLMILIYMKHSYFLIKLWLKLQLKIYKFQLIQEQSLLWIFPWNVQQLSLWQSFFPLAVKLLL